MRRYSTTRTLDSSCHNGTKRVAAAPILQNRLKQPSPNSLLVSAFTSHSTTNSSKQPTRKCQATDKTAAHIFSCPEHLLDSFRLVVYSTWKYYLRSANLSPLSKSILTFYFSNLPTSLKIL